MKSLRERIVQAASEEPGGGVVGRAQFGVGYWAYTSLQGADRAGNFFPIDPGTDSDEAYEAAKAEAKANAKAFAAQHQVGIGHALCLHLYRDSCVRMGTDGNEWNSDQFETVPTKPMYAYPDSDSCASLMMDAVEELGIPEGEDFYGRFTRKQDPYKASLGESAKVEVGDRLMYPTFWFPVEVYPDAATAFAAAGSEIPFDGKDDSKPPLPEEWDSDMETGWVEMVNKYKAMAPPVRKKALDDTETLYTATVATKADVEAWLEYLS